jgi:chromosome segregation ATPase
MILARTQMDTERTFEQQIHAEIELLRAKFPQTQDLYREACVLLFFRFGITPTANKLYQFVRKGSMSAPAEALAKFWENLREKSRIRVEHPDLPDDLRTAAGELTATLWTKALAQAQESLAAFRNEAQASLLEAKTIQAAAEAAREAAQQEVATAKTSLSHANKEIRDLEQQLAAAGATQAAMERQIQQAGQDVDRLQSALEDSRHEFASQLEKHRAGAQLAEERFRAAEERALREIDHERTQAAKLQKELEQARSGASQAADRHQAETVALHGEAGQLRQRIGILEGNLQAALAERERLSVDAEGFRRQVTETASQAAGFRADAENWQRRAEEAQQAVADLQPKAARRPRKANTKEKDAKLL